MRANCDNDVDNDGHTDDNEYDDDGDEYEGRWSVCNVCAQRCFKYISQLNLFLHISKNRCNCPVESANNNSGEQLQCL